MAFPLMRTLALSAVTLGRVLAERSADDAFFDDSLGERAVEISAHADGHVESLVESGRANGSQQTFPSDGYICCLKGLNVDAKAYPTDVVEVRFTSQSGIKECILTAFPPGCQKGGRCDAECKKILGTSLRFQTLRYSTTQKDMQSAVEETGKMDTAAEATKNKAIEQLKKEESSTLKNIAREYTKKVTPPKEAYTKADLELKKHREIVLSLEEKLIAAKQKRDDAKNKADRLKKSWDEAVTNGKKEKDAQTKSANKKRTDGTSNAEKTYSNALDRSKKILASWSAKVKQVEKEVQVVQGDAALVKETAQKRGPCAESNEEFAGEDCCCSIHADGLAVAMRVKGDTFTNWNLCVGAMPYSKTAFMGSSCNWFGQCGKCQDKICLNDQGGAGACP